MTALADAGSGTVASVVASPLPMSSASAARTAWRISAADNSTPQRWRRMAAGESKNPAPGGSKRRLKL
jgi:hypothetical protein